MSESFLGRLSREIAEIDERSLTKIEHQIVTSQGGEIAIASAGQNETLLNLCSNNYLGLANNPDVMRAALEAGRKYGFGMASVRFICGTLDIHRQLEKAISEYVGCEDAILFAACFDANGGVFEPLFDQTDAIVSDTCARIRAE